MSWMLTKLKELFQRRAGKALLVLIVAGLLKAALPLAIAKFPWLVTVSGMIGIALTPATITQFADYIVEAAFVAFLAFLNARIAPPATTAVKNANSNAKVITPTPGYVQAQVNPPSSEAMQGLKNKWSPKSDPMGGGRE